ncbi:hypothetical protein N1851_027128 [Merluccius polli]|uniref:Uncharacterized protein n=1 Tax=Merluccius polli TaxID=89951 RepID=A0AA47NSE6_MERPO|nr:hypothetical protein N1851_027128 [Merluccius polli]
MDVELALNASDCDLLDEISNTPEVSETSSSPAIPARQPPRLRSAVHVRRRLSPPRSDSSNIVGPSQPHSPRGRTRLRRPSYTADSRRSSPARSRSSHASDRRNRREAISPRQHAVRPSATGIADWTVASLKRSLTRHNIPFHSSDRKALFQRLQDFQLNSASPRRTPLPAPPPAGSSLFPLYPPPPPNYTLATASLPVRPTASSRPSPVSSTLRQQILSGNYVDLAQLIHPSTCNPHIPRELQTSLGTFQLKQPLTTHSKELTAPEFTFAFSLFRDIICSAFPDRRSELDDYLSLTIDLALRFGGNGFYSYHILFASRAAERLQQFNQGTYWGTLDTELYCRIFAARSSLNCEHFITFAHSIQKIKSSTIQVYLSGINFFAKLSSGSPCPALTHAHISMLLKGLRKAEPRPMPKRLPLTSDLLTRCIETLRKGYLSPSTDKVLESMFLLAFFGFLRCSEFTASTLLYDPSRHASVSDISVISPDTLVYFLKRSKTNQSETGRVATRSWFHHHFRQILSRSGIPPEPYSGHSFRIGAASTASRQGIPDNVTKILGRWSSTAYLTYVRNDLRDVRNAHALLSA